MKRWIMLWVAVIFLVAGCSDDAATKTDNGTHQPWDVQQQEDASLPDAGRPDVEPSDVRPPDPTDVDPADANPADADLGDADLGDTCPAVFSGAQFENGACAEGSVSGCSNPFPYADLASCCAAHEGASGCETPCMGLFEGAVVENGACVEKVTMSCEDPQYAYADLEACCAANEGLDGCDAGGPGTCDGFWEGANFQDGACVAGGVSGCSNPFTYENLEQCCEAHAGVPGCPGGGGPGNCAAYWEGAVLENGACVARSGSGCSNPFPYESVAQCCQANTGAGGCDQDDLAQQVCEAAGGQWHEFPTTCTGSCGAADRFCGPAHTWGCLCDPNACWDGQDCVPRDLTDAPQCTRNEDCSSSDYCNDAGRCERICHMVKCTNGFQCVHGACEPVPEKQLCETAGGQWHEFPNTCAGTCGPRDQERACGDAMTWGCLCPGNQCWNGTSCNGFVDEIGNQCTNDAACGAGKVCETDTQGRKVCVSGCHTDSQCPSDEFCNTNIQCITLPCPGHCQAR